MLQRIKYVSQFSSDLSEAEVNRIAEQAARRNAERDVTGVLMTAGGIFFQILEGPPEAVTEIYDRILADERHTDVLLLSSEVGLSGRLFPDWSMAKADLDRDASLRLEPLRVMLRSVFEQRRLMESMVEVLGRAVWYEMAASQPQKESEK
jgi:hypothetical protein